MADIPVLSPIILWRCAFLLLMVLPSCLSSSLPGTSSSPSDTQIATAHPPTATAELTPEQTSKASEEAVLRVGDLLAQTSKNEVTGPDATPTEVTTRAAESSASPIGPTDVPQISGEIEADQPPFDIGNELTVAALGARAISGSQITFEEKLIDGNGYSRHIVSYLSEGLRVYGLLTVPFGAVPGGGFKAVVFNHGFIPPQLYQTTERYVAYVNALATSGFVVFKIDLRGHGNSEGEPSGTYFSPDYTIDAIAALKSLQTLELVDPQGIGMWGHSMAGNLVLRAMLVEPDVKAGVIWAGAVYSYDDFARYAIADPSFDRSAFAESPSFRRSREIREAYGTPDTSHPYWRAVSLTQNLETLEAPIQLHHALNDDVVDVGYSIDLAEILTTEAKPHEFYQYEGGGHNINSPYFERAMERTITFYRTHL